MGQQLVIKMEKSIRTRPANNAQYWFWRTET